MAFQFVSIRHHVLTTLFMAENNSDRREFDFSHTYSVLVPAPILPMYVYIVSGLIIATLCLVNFI